MTCLIIIISEVDMNVAVIFGGESCEHDISIITGEQLINNCNEYLYNVIPIYIDKNGDWLTGDGLKDIDTFKDGIKKAKKCVILPNDGCLYIQRGRKYIRKEKIDMAFVCMHGLRGEDGSVAGILELCKIPYSSSSMCGSAISMDKCVTKVMAKGLGIDTLEYMVICENDYYKDIDGVKHQIENLGYPVIIKPSRQGSSIGIYVLRNSEDADKLIKKAFKYDKKLLIEKYIDIGKEVNIAILKDKNDYIFSETEEPISGGEILSFDNKYRKNPGGFETIKRIMPANINENITELIKDNTLKFYKATEMFGVARFDYLLGKDGGVYLNEVNSIPGSMANYLFDKNTLNYPQLIEKLISNASFRYDECNDVERVFDSGVLENDFDGFKK